MDSGAGSLIAAPGPGACAAPALPDPASASSSSPHTQTLALAHPSLRTTTKLGPVTVPPWASPIILYDACVLDVDKSSAVVASSRFTELSERWHKLCGSEYKTLPIANACCVQSLPGGPDVGCKSADCAAARRHYDLQARAGMVKRMDIHGRLLPRAKNRGGFGYWQGYLYLLAIDIELVANSFMDKISAEALRRRWSAGYPGRPDDDGIDRAIVVVRAYVFRCLVWARANVRAEPSQCSRLTMCFTPMRRRGCSLRGLVSLERTRACCNSGRWRSRMSTSPVRTTCGATLPWTR